MVGRVFLSPKPAAPERPPFAGRRNWRRGRKPGRKFRRRQSRQALFDDFWSDLFDDGETSQEEEVATAAPPPPRGQTSASEPVQYVYFFKRGWWPRARRGGRAVP